MNKEAIKLALQYIEANAETQDELEIAEGLRQVIADLNADYERGFTDGMQKQMQSSVDKAVNAMSQRTWIGLNGADWNDFNFLLSNDPHRVADWVEKLLMERNT
jgi:hypothetical protein